MVKALAHYRALEAGADPAVVAGWIAETQAERQRAEQPEQPTADEVANTTGRLTEEEIIANVEELGDMVNAWRDAEPEHKLEVHRSLGRRLTYDPKYKRCGQMSILPRTVRIRFVSEGDSYTNLRRPC